MNFDEKIPCIITTGKQVKQTDSSKSNVTNKQARQTPSAAKTKRPVTANRKSNVNSKPPSPGLSPSKKSTREKLNDNKASQDKKPQKDKYKFNSFQPKIQPLKKRIDTQNKNVPKAEQTKKVRPLKFRETKHNPSKTDTENQEIKVIYQKKNKTSKNSKYDGRPRSYSAALPKNSEVEDDDSEEVREKKPLLGSVYKNDLEISARTANSLRILVTGAESNILPDVQKSTKPSTFQLPNKGSRPGGRTESKSTAESPQSNNLRKSPTGSPKFSPPSTSPPKLATPPYVVSQYQCCGKWSECRILVSGGGQTIYQPSFTLTDNHTCDCKCTNNTKNYLGPDDQPELKKYLLGKTSPTNRSSAESPKPVASYTKMSIREDLCKIPCRGKCTPCIKSQIEKDHHGLNVFKKNSRESKLSQTKRLPKESPKQSPPGSPSKVPSPGEVLRHPCCEKCYECENCLHNRKNNNSQLNAGRCCRTKSRGKEPPISPPSRAGSPTLYSRATETKQTRNSANHQYTRDHNPKSKQPVEQDERQKKKKMLINKFIQQMDRRESEVSINVITKNNCNLVSSNPNHTKVTVNIDSERELYDLMFRKNSNNFGNLTVMKTVKNRSPESSFSNSNKAKSNSGNQQKKAASNNTNGQITKTHNGKITGSEHQDQLLHSMGDDESTTISKNGRRRVVSVSFNKFDIKNNTLNQRRPSPGVVLRHQSVPAALRNKLENLSESDEKIDPDYKGVKRISLIRGSIGSDIEIPERETFQSNDYKMSVPESTTANRGSTATNRRYTTYQHTDNYYDNTPETQYARFFEVTNANNTEETRFTFDSAVGGAVELPKRITNAEEEIRVSFKIFVM